MKDLFLVGIGVLLGYALFKENKKSLVQDLKDAGTKVKEAVDNAVSNQNPNGYSGIDAIIFPQKVRESFNASEKVTVSPAKAVISTSAE